jgi:hypothetical protein
MFDRHGVNLTVPKGNGKEGWGERESGDAYGTAGARSNRPSSPRVLRLLDRFAGMIRLPLFILLAGTLNGPTLSLQLIRSGGLGWDSILRL